MVLVPRRAERAKAGGKLAQRGRISLRGSTGVAGTLAACQDSIEFGETQVELISFKMPDSTLIQRLL